MNCWNPYLETFTRERLRATELKNFRQILRYAKKYSSFCRDKFRGVEPEEKIGGDVLAILSRRLSERWR